MNIFLKLFGRVTVGKIEAVLNAPGLFHNPNGRDTRSDKFYKNWWAAR